MHFDGVRLVCCAVLLLSPACGDDSSTGGDGTSTEGATTEGATTEGATTEGATTEGATTEGATTEGATTGEALDGMMIYGDPVEDGNSFACYTCHALFEPAPNGIRRAGHEIGSATRRPHFKNELFTDIRDAANTCLVEWMNAEAWEAEDPRWVALHAFLDSMAEVEVAEAITVQIVQPPADLSGGDAATGQALFNTSCSMCHGTDASGSNQAPPLAGTGLEASYVATRVRTSGLSSSETYDDLTGGKMPFWGADRLSDTELLDLIAYVTTSEPPPPGTGGGTTEGGTGGEGTTEGGTTEGGTGGEGTEGGTTEGGTTEGSACTSDHAKVGQIAILKNHFHGIGGTATILDDCTIGVESFDFDGNGINVQMYAGLAGNYEDGFSISDNLKNFPVGYQDASLTFTLPEGRTMDDLDGISVWCVPVGVSFGDGLFQAP